MSSSSNRGNRNISNDQGNSDNDINSISNRAITEQKDLETEDEDDMKLNANSDQENEDENNVMSNEEFARRAAAFRRSGAFSRRRTNMRLTMGSADLLRNHVLNTRRQIQRIINDTASNNTSNVNVRTIPNRGLSSINGNNNDNTNALNSINESENNDDNNRSVINNNKKMESKDQ